MRLLDTPEAGDVWLPLAEIAEAKLVLTDALDQGGAASPPRRPKRTDERHDAQLN